MTLRKPWSALALLISKLKTNFVYRLLQIYDFYFTKGNYLGTCRSFWLKNINAVKIFPFPSSPTFPPKKMTNFLSRSQKKSLFELNENVIAILKTVIKRIWNIFRNILNEMWTSNSKHIWIICALLFILSAWALLETIFWSITSNFEIYYNIWNCHVNWFFQYTLWNKVNAN